MANRKPFSGWKRSTAFIRPTLPSEIASEIGGIVPGDLGHEPQMTVDQLVRGVAIAVLAPALG